MKIQAKSKTAKETPHAVLFQAITLLPSNGGTGIKLKAPRKAFIETPIAAIFSKFGNARPKNKNPTANAKFTMGPANAIFPFCSFETAFPKIYTAPGAAKTNPPFVIHANSKARNNPVVHVRYSA